MFKLRKNDLYVVLIVLFPICALAEGWLSYYDELLGLCFMIYIITQTIRGRNDKRSSMIVILLGIISLIGLLSNVLSKLMNNPFPIAVDLISLWKTFACFSFFQSICSNERRRDYIVFKLKGLAKILLLLVAVTSIIQQIVDIGAAGHNNSVFFGLKQFGFFWNNSISTGWLVFGCLLLLAAAHEKKIVRYFIISCVPLLLTFSSLVYCWLFVAVFLYIVMRKESVFKIRYIIILAIAVVVFSFADISTYFYDLNSPRMMFILYGIKTANNYFPIGSGFATYGTEMAARYYSQLYISYGWRNLWTLGENGYFLNDTFFAGILGQFGWIGLILYFVCLYMLYKSINTNRLVKNERVLSLATVITIAVVMISSGSAKSIMGVFVFAVLGIVAGSNFGLYENRSKLRN